MNDEQMHSDWEVLERSTMATDTKSDASIDTEMSPRERLTAGDLGPSDRQDSDLGLSARGKFRSWSVKPGWPWIDLAIALGLVVLVGSIAYELGRGSLDSSGPASDPTNVAATTPPSDPTNAAEALDRRQTTAPGSWEVWAEEALEPLADFVSDSVAFTLEYEDAARQGDFDRVEQACLDGSSATFTAKRKIPRTPEPRVTQALDDWLNAEESFYYACSLGNYEEAFSWLLDSDQAFEHVSRLLEDRLS